MSQPRPPAAVDEAKRTIISTMMDGGESSSASTTRFVLPEDLGKRLESIHHELDPEDLRGLRQAAVIGLLLEGRSTPTTRRSC
ncbi:MAG: hypothetical protein HC927_09620 [Deltaproteobacteria bacterium]|nr:hypothetical protein [Deltaproteobacteria bacterium]